MLTQCIMGKYHLHVPTHIHTRLESIYQQSKDSTFQAESRSGGQEISRPQQICSAGILKNRCSISIQTFDNLAGLPLRTAVLACHLAGVSCRHPELCAKHVSECLTLNDQLLSGLELLDNRLGCVTDAFHIEVPSPICPNETSHSPWTDGW